MQYYPAPPRPEQVPGMYHYPAPLQTNLPPRMQWSPNMPSPWGYADFYHGYPSGSGPPGTPTDQSTPHNIRDILGAQQGSLPSGIAKSPTNASAFQYPPPSHGEAIRSPTTPTQPGKSAEVTAGSFHHASEVPPTFYISAGVAGRQYGEQLDDFWLSTSSCLEVVKPSIAH